MIQVVVAVPNSAELTIRVYDLLGRLVATPYDSIPSPGYQSFVWHAENFASGIYLFAFEQNGQQFAVEKVLLVR